MTVTEKPKGARGSSSKKERSVENMLLKVLDQAYRPNQEQTTETHQVRCYLGGVKLKARWRHKFAHRMDIVLKFPDEASKSSKSGSRTNTKTRNGTNRRSQSIEQLDEDERPLAAATIYVSAHRYYEGRTIKEKQIDRVCSVARQVAAQGAVLIMTPGCRIQPRTWTYARNAGVALLTFIHEQAKSFLWNLHVARAAFTNGYWIEDLVGDRYSKQHLTLKADATISSASPAVKNKLIGLDECGFVHYTSALVKNERLKQIQKRY